jgi:hypothetical protein
MTCMRLVRTLVSHTNCFVEHHQITAPLPLTQRQVGTQPYRALGSLSSCENGKCEPLDAWLTCHVFTETRALLEA